MGKNEADFLKDKLELDYFGIVGMDLNSGILNIFRKYGGWELGENNMLGYWIEGNRWKEVHLPVIPEKYIVMCFVNNE